MIFSTCRRAAAALMLLFLSGCATHQPIQYQISCNYTVRDPQFLWTMASLLGTSLRNGNDVRTLSNGDEIFPPMLAAISMAQKSITLESYTYEKGNIGKKFADALSERARAGVKVNVLLDAVGADDMDPASRKQMDAAGVHLREYNPFHLFEPFSYAKMDHRTHRKIMVVDGLVGFIGGVGIADQWTGHAQDAAHWRDNEYRVTGPVVGQLQAAFADNWMETTGVVLQGDEYFPLMPSGREGGMIAQMFRSSAEGGSQTMQLLFLLSVCGAGNTIRLETPYFVPDEQTQHYLMEARRRGVTVEVILPGDNSDMDFVRDASRASWGKLLQAGIEIYEYQPTMLHSKLLIVDDIWVSIGSSNLDNRSFGLNAEANLNVYDAKFAAQQVRIFEEDKTHSQRVTYDQWTHRPLFDKIRDAVAAPMSPEL